MASLAKEILIDAPVEQVFDFVASEWEVNMRCARSATGQTIVGTWVEEIYRALAEQARGSGGSPMTSIATQFVR